MDRIAGDFGEVPYAPLVEVEEDSESDSDEEGPKWEEACRTHADCAQRPGGDSI